MLYFEFKDDQFVKTTTAISDDAGYKYFPVPENYDAETQYPILVNNLLQIIEKTGSTFMQLEEEGRYEKREKAGRRFIRKMGAQLNLDSGLTDLEKQELDETFASVRDALGVGFWKTAKREMDKITVAPPLEQTLFDYVYGVINQFITDNY